MTLSNPETVFKFPPNVALQIPDGIELAPLIFAVLCLYLSLFSNDVDTLEEYQQSSFSKPREHHTIG
jgi:hypothetical protein